MLSKVLRENSRTFVLVIMSLLLVAFLLADVLQSCTDRTGMRNEKLGVAFATPVYSNDVQRAADKFRIARELGIVPGELAARINELDFHLLVTEAQKAGIYVGRSDLEREFQDNPIVAQRLEELRIRYHLSLDAIYGVLADWIGVMNYWQIQRDALGGSLPRAEVAYRNQRQEAAVQISVLDSKAFLTAIPEPTEQELSEFFQQSRDRFTQHTEDTLEFGYKLPDRVQIEYATIDPRSMQDNVQVRAAEVRRFFEANPKRYETRVPRPSTQPSDPSQPPPVPEFDIVIPSFEEVQDRVREDCRASKAVEEGQRIINQIRDRLNDAWAASEPGPDGIRPSPQADRIESLEAICAAYNASGIPVVYKKTELIDASGIQREGNLGSAQYTTANQQIRMTEIMMRVKGIYTPQTDAGQREVFPILNLMEPSPVMIWARPIPGMGQIQRFAPYQAYVFRVTQVAPSAPPESIDEVRDRLVTDWKVSQAYRKAEEFAKRLADRAREIGLEAATAEMVDLKSLLEQADIPPATQPGEPPRAAAQYTAALGPNRHDNFTRGQRFLLHVGVSPNLHKRIFELVDLTAEDPPPAHRVVLVPNGLAQKWIVAELLELKPLYQDEFESQRNAMQDRMSTDENVQFYNAWFDSNKIRARVGFVSAAPAR